MTDARVTKTTGRAGDGRDDQGQRATSFADAARLRRVMKRANGHARHGVRTRHRPRRVGPRRAA